mmetsp:Transcript_57548/g.122400  ORF Transcript_57548/g.122400 Transcript_57548/m.122400 type:complete len:226 (+) Transcript_57548:921-1598(+)
MRTCASAKTRWRDSVRKRGLWKARRGKRRRGSLLSSTGRRSRTTQGALGSRTRPPRSSKTSTTSSASSRRSGCTLGLATRWVSTRSGGFPRQPISSCRRVWMALARSGTITTKGSACAPTWVTIRVFATSISPTMGGGSTAFPTTRTSSTGIQRPDRSSPPSPTRRPISPWQCIPTLPSRTSSLRVAPTRRQCSGMQTQRPSCRSTTSTWVQSTQLPSAKMASVC